MLHTLQETPHTIKSNCVLEFIVCVCVCVEREREREREREKA